jgi:hypothetical protein
MFKSYAKQDEFVANIFEFKKDGTFLDIGSHHAEEANNTFYLEKNLHWNGICVELDSGVQSSYDQRPNCKFFNQNAFTIDYKNAFNQNNYVDYLSLDIDTHSFDLLKVFPLDDIEFGVITIEHDAYLYGDTYRKPQRELLKYYGYELLCGNVYVEQAGFEEKLCPFEDWYINPAFVNSDKLKHVQSENEYPSQIISKFKTV